MRLIRFFLAIGIALLAVSGSAAAMVVSVENTNGGAGSKVMIPVKVGGATNLAAIGIVITYDPAVLTFSSADLGEISTNGMIEANGTRSGIVKIGVVDTEGVNGDGPLVKMTFNVVGKDGATSPVNVQVTGAWKTDLVDIQTTSSGGTFTVGGKGIPVSPVTIVGAVCGACLLVFWRRKQR
jgi:hypothetical protein